jgi:general secretion pathway protein B
MSTILKALRKLETQSRPSPDSGGASPLRKISIPAETCAARIPVRVRATAIVLLIAAVAVFGWLRWPKEKPVAPPGGGAPIETSVSPASAEADSPGHAAGTTEWTAAVAPQRAVGQAPPSWPLATAPRPADKIEEAEGASPLDPVSGGRERPVDVTHPAAGGTLTVQAIAWSAEKRNRVAVINGQVLHEGEAIGRIRLSRIEKDHVVLIDDGRSWKVEFGR